MTGVYDREIAESLERIAKSMDELTRHFREAGDSATIAGQSIADAAFLSHLPDSQVHFIQEERE